MNKTQLFNALGGKISKSAIVRTDGDPGTFKVLGKFGEVEPMDDGTFDVWLTDTSSPASVLGTRKLNNMLSAVENALQIAVTQRYDGEAWLTLTSAADVRVLAPILKFRKARILSPEQKAVMRDRLAAVRAAA